MRFNGEWLLCDDGLVRPIIRAEILAGDGTWRAAEFLVDTGADRTLISANAFDSLDLPSEPAVIQIGGVGGLIQSVMVTTEIRLCRDDGQTATFRGEFAACASYEALDMSVLGRDVLEMFALIADRPANVLAILGGRHSYEVRQQ